MSISSSCTHLHVGWPLVGLAFHLLSTNVFNRLSTNQIALSLFAFPHVITTLLHCVCFLKTVLHSTNRNEEIFLVTFMIL